MEIADLLGGFSLHLGSVAAKVNAQRGVSEFMMRTLMFMKDLTRVIFFAQCVVSDSYLKFRLLTALAVFYSSG